MTNSSWSWWSLQAQAAQGPICQKQNQAVDGAFVIVAVDDAVDDAPEYG